MDLISSARILWRRKSICAAVLALTAILAIVIGGGIKPNHAATGQLVLLPPAAAPATAAGDSASAATERPNNPFTQAGGLGVLAQAVVSVISDTQSVDRIVAAGGLDTFTLTADEQGGGSFITAKVTGTDAERVLTTYQLVVDAYTRELANQQQLQSVRPEDQIRLQPLVTPIATTKDIGSRVQALLIIGLLGTMAAVGAAFMVESYVEGREAEAGGLLGRRARGDEAGTVDDGDDELRPFLDYLDDDELGPEVVGGAEAPSSRSGRSISAAER